MPWNINVLPRSPVVSCLLFIWTNQDDVSDVTYQHDVL